MTPDDDLRPWLRTYPPEVDWHAEIEPMSLPDMLARTARLHGDRPAFDFLGRRTTWAQAAAASDRIAAGLMALGLARGTRLGLLMPNCPAYPLVFFAALRAGLVVVNFNPLYTDHELAAQARDAGVAIMATLDLAATYPKAARLLDAGVISRVLVCPFAPMLPHAKGIAMRVLKRGTLARPPRDPRHVWLSDLLATATPPPPIAIDPVLDLAVLQYTGGTSGLPKGAMLSHANLHANAVQGVLWFHATRPGQERVLAALPFFHVFALTTVLLFSVQAGAEIVMLPRFVPADALAAIARTRTTYLAAVPTMLNALAAFPGKADLSSIRYCISGGAPLPAEVKKRFEARTGCVVVEGYGLTEASPCTCCNPTTGENRDGTIGQPMSRTDQQLRAPADPMRRVPVGERGELCVRGPQVMLGYWNRPEETASAFTPDGWLRTGDIGVMDADGYFSIVDRIKDLILCGGYNVYPRTIEEAIYRHPVVAEVTVIGVPDEYRGEAAKAFVVLKPGAMVTAAELVAFLREYLSPIELPRHVEFRDTLPKTLIGKLSKKELVAEEAARRSV